MLAYMIAIAIVRIIIIIPRVIVQFDGEHCELLS